MDFHLFPKYSAYADGELLILSSIYVVLLFSAVYLSLSKYYKKILDGDISLQHTYLLFSIPFLFYAVNVLIGNTVKKNFSKIPKEFFLPLFLWDVCALLSYFLTLKCIVDNKEASIERERLLAAQNQLELWEVQYKSLHDKILLESRIRHDWRQHLITIAGMTQDRDLESLEQYLADYKENYLVSDYSPLCDIPSLNLLFLYYQRKAEEMNIRLLISTVYFGECGISVTDFTVLFGNLLENALKASHKAAPTNQYINLNIVNRENKILFVCMNGFDESIEKEYHKDSYPPLNSGFGISSMQKIVEKYGGYLQFFHHNSIFKVSAYLQKSP